MVVQDKRKIQPSTGIEVGCANTGVMHQKGEDNLPFNSVSAGTNAVNIFHEMYSQVLSGENFVKEGKCTLVFGRENAHVIQGRTGELVQQIMKQAVDKNNDGIVMTVQFDKKTLTRKTG